ncbi:MAG: cytochrome b N-terminal domain-containing protein [Thermoguttaceae bacterium]
MRSIWHWFNERTGFGDTCVQLGNIPTPGRPSWCRTLPCAITFAFILEAITGFFLWAYYSPSTQTAWESVYYVQNHVVGGWLLRAMHHFTAHVLLAMLILYVVHNVLTGACRAPRELVFWATVGLGLCVLAAVLTGDLLSWDQNGYSATKTRTGFLMLLPWVGESLLKLAIGGPGPALGNLTLTRFFALHVGLFSGGFLLLLVIRGALAHRANAALAIDADEITPYWPRQAWRSALACLVVVAIVLVLTFRHGTATAGVPLLSPADTDPANNYAAARPEWFLVGVYEFSHLFPGQWGVIPVFVVPGLLVGLLLAMPFFARQPFGQAFNVVFMLMLLAAVVGMTYASYTKDRNDPAHQKAIALENWQSQRVRELARHEGIPPTGALTLLRNDPKTQGPRLFKQCASCHVHRADAYLMPDIKTESPSAPDLTAFASRPWLTGLLDPKQINGPAYYRFCKFRGGKMAQFVKENLGELDADEKQDLDKVIAAISAEAQLPAQRKIDARDAKRIAEGRELILNSEAPFTCTDCHQFHGKGKQGDAPSLTGYGSSEWIAGIVRNPADSRFYGKQNDRMPAYAPNTDPAQNTLSAKQIEQLTDWLRGAWHEESAANPGK